MVCATDSGMTDQWIIYGLAVATAGLASLTLVLYWFVVCVTLYLHGAKFPTGLMPWRYFRDLRDYKEIRLAKGRSPTLYYVAIILTWTTLALSLVLAGLLWQYYSQTTPSQRRPW